MIYVTSDLHIGHDRGFIYAPRGFNTITEHDKALAENWNKTVSDKDTIYVLGDLMLGDNEYGIGIIKQLKGKIRVILGNHDTSSREKLYRSIPDKIESVEYATIIKFNNYRFYLSHYPTMTASFEKESLSNCLIDLFGHTHNKDKFYNDIPWMYNVAVDANNHTPVSLEEVISNCEAKVEECKYFL